MMRLVDVYPYRSEVEQHLFLILKRAFEKPYASQWRMVAGKVETGETAWQAGLRELREETSLKPALFWTIPSTNNFYNHEDDEIVQIPAFAAQISNKSNIVLNEEHTEYRWINSSEIDAYIKWPEQRRLMQTIGTILNDQILEDWIISF